MDYLNEIEEMKELNTIRIDSLKKYSLLSDDTRIEISFFNQDFLRNENNDISVDNLYYAITKKYLYLFYFDEDNAELFLCHPQFHEDPLIRDWVDIFKKDKFTEYRYSAKWIYLIRDLPFSLREDILLLKLNTLNTEDKDLIIFYIKEYMSYFLEYEFLNILEMNSEILQLIEIINKEETLKMLKELESANIFEMHSLYLDKSPLGIAFTNKVDAIKYLLNYKNPLICVKKEYILDVLAIKNIKNGYQIIYTPKKRSY